ncbi:MAG TPA: protoglobin domain-containing protein [Polyangia bacterium]|nr:protoglobin domain-containing protein [Polyangia bacterium]
MHDTLSLGETGGGDGQSFLDGLKQYVGFTDQTAAILRSFHPVAAPHLGAIVDDFYATIERHPGARAAITGGPLQIERLKQTLRRWLDKLLLGPHDDDYAAERARIGRVHVQINLPQSYMFTAMNRIRTRLLTVAGKALVEQPERLQAVTAAVDQILDIELAIMLETYREALVARSRTSERLATIGQFAASIGHELRNPLGVIESSLYLLDQHLGAGVTAQPNVRKHLDRIAVEVKKSTKTIHDLLDLARNRAPRKLTTDLAELLSASIEAALLPTGVVVEGRIATDAATVDADPDQLRQVLSNLLTNSAQAGAGTIVVTSEALASGVALRVKDDGPGVPPAARERIFEAMFTTKAKGSGLGLSLCRQVVEAHGGTLELEPAPQGATFLITLPHAPRS